MKICDGIGFLAISIEMVLKKYGKWFSNYVWEF